MIKYDYTYKDYKELITEVLQKKIQRKRFTVKMFIFFLITGLGLLILEIVRGIKFPDDIISILGLIFYVIVPYIKLKTDNILIKGMEDVCKVSNDEEIIETISLEINNDYIKEVTESKTVIIKFAKIKKVIDNENFLIIVNRKSNIDIPKRVLTEYQINLLTTNKKVIKF